MYEVVGVGEPPKTGGSSSVLTCCSADMAIVVFPKTDVGSDGRDVRELLSLNGVGSDVLIAVTAGEMIERAGVDAGVVTLEVSAGGLELLRE